MAVVLALTSWRTMDCPQVCGRFTLPGNLGFPIWSSSCDTVRIASRPTPALGIAFNPLLQILRPIFRLPGSDFDTLVWVGDFSAMFSFLWRHLPPCDRVDECRT